MALLIRNLSQIATPIGRTGVRGAAMRNITVHDDAVIVVSKGRIAYVGPERRSGLAETGPLNCRLARADRMKPSSAPRAGGAEEDYCPMHS